MGSCASKTDDDGCVRGRLRFSKKKTMKQRYGLRRRVSSQCSNGSLDEVDNMPEPALSDRSFANPTFQGSFFFFFFCFCISLNWVCFCPCFIIAFCNFVI